MTFQTAPSGPATVNFAAANIPPGTVVVGRANPLIGAPTTANSSALTGSLQSSTAQRVADDSGGRRRDHGGHHFPVTTAMLDWLPLIPGMKPALIEVTADASGTSRMFVIGEDSEG